MDELHRYQLPKIAIGSCRSAIGCTNQCSMGENLSGHEVHEDVVFMDDGETPGMEVVSIHLLRVRVWSHLVLLHQRANQSRRYQKTNVVTYLKLNENSQIILHDVKSDPRLPWEPRLMPNGFHGIVSTGVPL